MHQSHSFKIVKYSVGNRKNIKTHKRIGMIKKRLKEKNWIVFNSKAYKFKRHPDTHSICALKKRINQTKNKPKHLRKINYNHHHQQFVDLVRAIPIHVCVLIYYFCIHVHQVVHTPKRIKSIDLWVLDCIYLKEIYSSIPVGQLPIILKCVQLIIVILFFSKHISHFRE